MDIILGRHLWQSWKCSDLPSRELVQVLVLVDSLQWPKLWIHHNVGAKAPLFFRPLPAGDWLLELGHFCPISDRSKGQSVLWGSPSP